MAPPDDLRSTDPDRTLNALKALELDGHAPEKNRPYLIVLSGPNLGEVYAVDGSESTIGRGPDATIRLLDDSISRMHVRVVADGGEVRIEDLGSANGTVLNSERVNVAPLRDGDKIQLGASTILKFTYHDRLEEEFRRKMYEAALRDPMTKAFNKKHLVDRLGAEIAYARRHRTPLSLLLLDIDHFKSVNDRHGHLAGDHVLVMLASTVQAMLRAEDILARYGGEEFAVLCRGSSPESAAILAERIRGTIEVTELSPQGRYIPITVSIGVTGHPGVDADTTSDFIAGADQALYEAKRTGRNRVIVQAGEW